MKSIPFSAPMVRAVRTGHKTQTRREMATQLTVELVGNTPYWSWIPKTGRTKFSNWRNSNALAAEMAASCCPYGKRGDRLWVREAWRTLKKYDGLPPREVPTDAPILYLAGDAISILPGGEEWGRYRHAWFMCQHFSRIKLEIVAVRVEPLWDISEADAVAEGIPLTNRGYADTDDESGGLHVTAKAAYRSLWMHVVGPSWHNNPWVWVVEFKRV
jgi:hypothetical protein